MKSGRTPDLYEWVTRNGVHVESVVPRYRSFWWDHWYTHGFVSYPKWIRGIGRAYNVKFRP